MAVSDRFKTLLDWTEPSPRTQQLFESHRSSVNARLKAAFDAVKVLLIGSNSRNTAVANESDIDLLLVLRTSEVSQSGYLIRSDTVLNNVRGRLQDRYTRTEIGRDAQAVVVDFSDGKHPVDVVPAVYVGPGVNNYPTYKIPDGNGGWMDTSPEIHNQYIAQADQRSGYKLQRVARLMKWWRASRGQPLNSFHLELLLADSGICTVPKSYAECVADSLALLAQRDARALQDPLGISGLVKAANTEPQRQQLVASLRQSAAHAREAVRNDGYGTLPEAYRQWDIVFNGNFPKQ